MEYAMRPSHVDDMTRAMRMLRLFVTWVAVTMYSRPAAAQASSPPAVRPATAIEAVFRALHTTRTDPHDVPLVAMADRFYADRQYAAAWTDARGYTALGEGVRRVIATAADEGLDPSAYRVPAITSGDPDSLARADVRLSLVALRFAQDLGWGVAIPGAVHRDHAFPRRAFAGDSLLHAWWRATDPGRALLDVAPRTFGYRRLRDALRQLRLMEQQGGWAPFPTGPTLRVGSAGPRVHRLRRELRVRGDLADPRPADEGVTQHGDDVFDDTLAAAVARFQERHGLAVDSALGPRTVAALGVPLSARITQVQLGMERARWLPPVDGDRWITVNLADYRAFLFDEGVPVFETRVVVGATNHKTPMFVDTLTNIVLNPAWNVPPSIAAREILPLLKRDPAYLTRNHMVRVNGGLQQVPGPWNALGQIAFMFPNPFNVYMHDTPARELFDAPDRAHSHGCIRVQRPRELAGLLLGSEGWAPAAIDSAIATGQRRVIRLRHPVPVRITYATAFSGNDGTLHFRPDVYGRDALLQRVLRQAWTIPLPAVLR